MMPGHTTLIFEVDCVCTLQHAWSDDLDLGLGKQLNAGLSCESGITCLWGWCVFELLEVRGVGRTQVNSGRGEYGSCKWK